MGNQLAKEQLYRFIAKNDTFTINKILDKFPALINQELTSDSRMTPLLKAINHKNIQIIQLLINKGADINKSNSKGITPLMMSCITRNLNLVIYFIETQKADYEIQSQDKMNALDYAIFYAVYDIAIYLNNLKIYEIKAPEFYSDLQRKYKTKYVNYQIFILHIQKNLPEQSLPDYLNKVKPILKDPVVDPRENWSQIFSRYAKFQNPPLIQREELPQNLRPQNRNILSRARTMIQVSRSEIRPKKISENGRIQNVNKLEEEDETNIELGQNKFIMNDKIINNDL